MKVYVVHSGCRLNHYETDALSSGLGEAGFTLIDEPTEADYIVMNTCTVTNRADYKNRSGIRRFHEINPSAKIIVTGCYATTDAAQIRTFPGVYKVVDNLNKAKIPALLNENTNQEAPSIDGQFGYSLRSQNGKKRAHLKIQDGCNKSCSYCKIPLARGPSRSRPYSETLAEAQELISKGFHELVLTGVNMGWYMANGFSFYDLVESILDLEGSFQVRVSSIEPMDANEKFAQLLKHPKMCKFAHVPLQSGSKQVLKWMRRGYTPKRFQENIEQLRLACPDVHIGTDIIVGFPGETEEFFQETLSFCETMRFANIHIFPYSKRKNTAAVQWLQENSKEEIFENKGDVIRERARRLATLKHNLQSQYLRDSVDKKWWAIVLDKETALTENYLTVSIKESVKTGKRVRIKLMDTERAILV